MKNTEIREFTLKELEERIENEENMLVRMKLNHAISPLDNPLKIRETRKNIARLKTELNKRRHNTEPVEQEEQIEQKDNKEQKEK